ncbi:MAG: hypothetical protein EAZ77_01250 [Nostocales cyanobacterium]|nr:MAG: hypothetical protein EAZ77_01250 [Nostocales cyanobacterium]
MALLLRSGESGFAVVIAVSLGLIMVLVGLTMTLRSQGDQVTASTQKSTERALAAAEKGIAFYQAFLNSSGGNRRLSQYPDCVTRASSSPGAVCSDPSTPSNFNQRSWSNVDNISDIASACNLTNTTQIKTYYASTDWKDVDSSDSSQGQFRLVSYKFYSGRLTRDPGTGRLIVEGRIKPTQGGNTGSTKSIARLEVGIPTTPGDVYGIPIPGVWVGGANNTIDDDGTGRNGVKGDVLVNNCNIIQANINQMQQNIVGNHKVRKTDLIMPSLPDQPDDRVIGSPADDPNFDSPHQDGTIPLGAVSGDVTLPVHTDDFSDLSNPKPRDDYFQTDFNGEETYVYSVTSFANNTTLKIKPGEKVAIFLSGSISSNVTITCETEGECNPMDLKIFGTGPVGSEICVNGNRGIDAFILAPNYIAGVAGGGNRQLNGVDAGNFRGAVWVRQWGSPGCGSSSQNMLVEQVGTWDDLPFLEMDGQLPPKIKPTGTWTRNPIN